MTGPGGLSPESERPLALLLALFERLPADLLGQALTHPHSVSDRTQSYERLEFLGDSVLGLAVAARLYRSLPQATEGQLAKAKAYAVSRPSCAAVAVEIGLADFIARASPSDEEHKRDMVANPTLLGNVLEALIGACFVAFGFAAVEEAIAEAFSGRIEHALCHTVDYKTALQEWLARDGRTVVYRVVSVEGPAHQRIFTSVAQVGGVEMGVGSGSSIKESEQAAARKVLERLGAMSDEKDSSWPS